MEYRLHSKDLAQSYATSVEPIWDSPILDQMRPHLLTTPGSTVLAAPCRTGRSCQLLLETIPNARVMAVDESRDMLDEARIRLVEADGQSVFFNCAPPDQLTYATGVFAQVVSVNGPVTKRKLKRFVGELNRVVSPTGVLALAAPLGPSVALYCDLLSEALWANGQKSIVETLQSYRALLLSAPDLEAAAVKRGATIIASGTLGVDFTLENPERLLLAPLMQQLFVPEWLEMLQAPQPRNQLLADVFHRLTAYAGEPTFAISIETAWLVAQTADERVDEIYETEDWDIVEIDETGMDDESTDLFDPMDDQSETVT